MGIYDRDYYRQGSSGFRLGAPRSAVGAIIVLNIAVFVLEAISGSGFAGGNTIVDLLSTHVDVGAPKLDTLMRPWMWWQFLTCGFVHDPLQVSHILFNMLALFFLGRDVEQRYGTREFIRLYLVMHVFSSVVFALANRFFDPSQRSVLFGASGAVSGVVILYALNFPKRTILLMFVIPMPAWLMGVLVVAIDAWGAMKRPGLDPKVAYTAHLAGAAFALAYFNLHWNFGQLTQSAATWLKGRSRPSLKVFKPADEPDAPVADEEVDRVLEKIHREGENSLTRRERRILENASREYQRRRRPD